MSTSKSFIVPRDNNTYLLSPSNSSLDELLSSNVRVQSQPPVWLRQLRTQARADAVEEADRFDAWCIGYTNDLRVVKETPKPALWIAGGHQPELFHPGVWFKNYLLSGLSRQRALGGQICRPLHVIIDHDLAKADTIKTPYGKGGRLAQRTNLLPFRSLEHPPLPWHSTYLKPSMLPMWREIVDIVTMDCRSQGWEPLLTSNFSILERCIANSETVGDAFSIFRRSIELACGMENREVRMSQLCSRSAFGEFVFRCLCESIELVEAYNGSREAYRRQRKIRNTAQPVPELQSHSGWVEMPFWIYRSLKVNSEVQNDHYRNKLWFYKSDEGCFLANAPSHAASIHLRVPINFEFDATNNDWRESWGEWNRQGICIRPRALMTTLFLRYILSDLFVHGVGGGLYDSVTDEIAHRLWGLLPPKMIVASATLQLPIIEPVHTIEFDESRLRNQLRWLRSSPERFLDLNSSEDRDLLEQHQSLIATVPEGKEKSVWHGRMMQLRTEILQKVRSTAISFDAASSQLIQQRQQKAICSSREYSFAVFSEGDVTHRLKNIVEQAVGVTEDRTGK